MKRRQRTTSDGLAILDRRHFQGRPVFVGALDRVPRRWPSSPPGVRQGFTILYGFTPFQ
jgi:hypothetical protein